MTPTGAITTTGFAGKQWQEVTRYDASIRSAADPVGWPIERIRSHILIESGGDPSAVQHNPSNGDSYGLLQIVPYGVGWAGWHDLVSQKGGLGRNPSSSAVVSALLKPELNIRVGVAILEGFYQQYGTLSRASSAFFLGNPDWKGRDTVNGNTGDWYRDTLTNLIKEQQAFAPPDIIGFIVSGVKYTAEFGFGAFNWNPDGSPANYYKYGVGHGEGLVAANQHTGLDIVVPLQTPIRTPLSGVVRCVGDAGEGNWGQGCGSFPDTLGRGVGNVTVLTDVGLKITFGHVHSTTLRPGQYVAAGEEVARSGGMVAPHLHLDVSINRDGSYWLLDPIPAIAGALGQDVPAPPPSYAGPIAVPQPREFTTTITVTALRDDVPVLQRADLLSSRTNKPLAKGDTFEAVYQVIGDDRQVYWVSTRSSRIPVNGTTAPNWNGGGPVTCPPDRAPQIAADILAVLDKYPKERPIL